MEAHTQKTPAFENVHFLQPSAADNDLLPESILPLIVPKVDLLSFFFLA